MFRIALVVTATISMLAGASHAHVEGLTALPGGDTTRLSVIGWSKDERYVAVRIYGLFDPESYYEGPPPTPCAGYVDERGKRFQGSLDIVLFDGGAVLSRTSIQGGKEAGAAEDGCTPPAVAKQRLEAVKGELAKLGIGSAPGTELDVSMPMSLTPPGAKAPQIVKLDAWSETKEVPNEAMLVMNGTFALRQGERVIKRVKASNSTTGAMASRHSLSAGPAFLSPSGKRLLLFVHEDFTSGRGNSRAPWLFGVYEWQGEQLVAR